MNDPKKLSIRINFVAKKEMVAEQAGKEENGYIYHWQRIVAASVLTITTVTLLVYGGFNYFNQDQGNNNVPGLVALASANAAPLQDQEQKSITRQGTDIDSEKIQPSSLENSVMQTQTNSDTVLLTGSINEESDKVQLAEKSSAAVKTNLEVSSEPPFFLQSAAEIFSRKVQRFLIAKTVKKKEPVGSINDIKFDVNNIATVYAYSHVVGLKGETLYYKWTLNDKKIALVKIRVGSDSWRSYSRKYIQPHMHGKWRVTLENSKGEILAVNRFNY